MTSTEQYEQELKQSEIDHHTPTAGAMTGHIIANLLIHSLKISQAKMFAKGPAALFLSRIGDKWISHEQTEFAHFNQLLVNNGESIPTTTDQFKQFTMLKKMVLLSTSQEIPNYLLLSKILILKPSSSQKQLA